MDPGVQIVPGNGHVLVRGPLVVVMSGSAAAAQDANVLINELHGLGQWGFESVAAALQELVTHHELMGVAAVNILGTDPTLFLFDGAEASTDHGPVEGQGRSEWVTEVLEGDHVEIRLAAVRGMPPVHGTELRDGIVPGAGALVTLRGSSPPSAATPSGTAAVPGAVFEQPPPPMGAPPVPAPGIVSPPPPANQGLGRPTRVPAPPPPPPTPEAPRT